MKEKKRDIGEQRVEEEDEVEKEDKKEGGERRRDYFEMQINQMQCCLCPDFNALKKDTYERIEKMWV